jgi:hypothetical protein
MRLTLTVADASWRFPREIAVFWTSELVAMWNFQSPVCKSVAAVVLTPLNGKSRVGFSYIPAAVIVIGVLPARNPEYTTPPRAGLLAIARRIVVVKQ